MRGRQGLDIYALMIKTFIPNFSGESLTFLPIFFKFLCNISLIPFLLSLSFVFKLQTSLFASRSLPNVSQTSKPPSSTMPVRDLRSTMDEGIPNNFVWRISDSHYGVPSADSGISLAASHGAIYRDQTVPRTIYQRAYYQHYRHQAVFIPDRIELREYIPQGGSQSPSWTNLSHTLFVRPNAVALAPLRNELPPFTYSFCWVNNSLSEIPAWEASSSVTNTTLLQNLPPPFTYPLNSTSISTSSMPAVEASSNFTDQSLPKTALETTLSSGPPSSTWISVPDPVALAGLIERPGLAGAPAYPKIVGFEGRILHQLFEFLDPCAATCKLLSDFPYPL